jgi:LPPG:FO 2-phospho-L-lactate transferase
MSSDRSSEAKRVIALCGGVGGAKLALGLQDVLGEDLDIVVNVADDFRHLGLYVSPDLDTVLYTLGGLNDEKRGWGRADETWNFMAAMTQVGGDTWFSLGDRDLALHVERSRRLAAGQTLTQFAADIARRFGIRARICPVTDDRIRTMVATPDGELEFQHYFVEQRCEPTVTGIRFDGAGEARMTREVGELLSARDVRMIVISVTTAQIAAHYDGLADGLVVDAADDGEVRGLSLPTYLTATLMTDRASKVDLARHVLAFGDRLRGDVAR